MKRKFFQSMLFVNAGFFFVSAVIYTIIGSELWFNRACISIISFGFAALLEEGGK